MITPAAIRVDLQLIADMVEPGGRALDVGCGDGSLSSAFNATRSRFCVISFTSDWLFPTSESREVVRALNAAAANVSFVEIETDKGHDAFLLHEPELFATLRGFLTGCAEHRSLPRFWSAA